jgi:hypothetical protein
MSVKDVSRLRQLGQLRPTNTTAASLYSPAAKYRATIESIIVCNTTTGAITFRIFHDDDGTTYDETTALFFDEPLAANVTREITFAGEGIYLINTSANLAVRTSSNSAITFTCYGFETLIGQGQPT